MEPPSLNDAVRAYRGALLALLAFSFVLNLLLLAAPLYMMLVFDHVLTSRSVDTLIVLTLIAGFALIFYGLFDILRAQILARIAAGIDDRLAPAVMTRVLALGRRTPAGTTAHALRDLATLQGFFTGPAAVSLVDAPWAVLFSAALFVLHPLLGIAGIAAACLLFAVALVNEWSARAPLRQARMLASRVGEWTEAAARNAETVAGMGMTGAVLQEWERRRSAALRPQLLAADRSAMATGIAKSLRMMIQIVILAFGAELVLQRQIGAGTMVAASLLLARMLAPIEGSIGNWRLVLTARLAHRRLKELLSLEAGAEALAAPAPVRTRPEGVLSAEGVAFIPAGGQAPILRNISLRLEPGEALGIAGPAAAGKSTLARLLVGAAAPSFGQIRLDGAELAVWQRQGGARHFGYLPQVGELLAGTVRENIARFADTEPEAVFEAARLAGVHEAIMRLPRAYDTPLGTEGARLSGGQRQGVALARAFFERPAFIVLDEPGLCLDAQGKEALLRALAELKRASVTLAVVTHDPALLDRVDKLLVLNQGMMVAFGPRAEVLEDLGQTALPAARRRAPALRLGGETRRLA